MDTQPHLENKDFYHREQIITLVIIGFGWGLFLTSAMNYSSWPWFNWLVASRFFTALLAFSLAIYIWKKKPALKNLDTIFLTYALAIQSTHGSLEPSNMTDFYSYTGVFYIISALVTRGAFKEWVKKFFPVQILCLVVPLFFKDAKFFSGIGIFVDSFSMPLIGLILGSVIARVNSKRYELLENNIRLNKVIAKQEREQKEMLQNLANQVRHDSASPIMAIKMISKMPNLDPQIKPILEKAILRTEEIFSDLQKARDLASLHKNENDLMTKFNFKELVLEIQKEKETTWGNLVNIDLVSEGDDFFITSNKKELARGISNTLNNAKEAMVDSNVKRIKMVITSSPNEMVLTIEDFGPGIPASILNKIGTRGVTLGKATGSGLGVYQTKTAVESGGGVFTISNKVGGTGAIVKIQFKK